MHLLERNCQIASTLAQVVTAIATCYLIWFAHKQFEQADLHKQWQNYNDINSRYAELYKELPAALSSASVSDAAHPDKASINWARRYFDLTSEEYWLHQNRLLPNQMWHCRIAPGIARNFSEIGNLKIAYEQWKRDFGATAMPDFVQETDSLLA